MTGHLASTGTVPGGVSVVFPAYNEESNIGPQVESALAVLEPMIPNLEVIVVNDGSRDGTAAAVQALTVTHPNVRLVSHPTNYGYGAALYSGFTAATRTS